MDICLVIKQRLEELGLEQRDLAAAAGVTESYISQLLTRKKLPPAPGRTDIYDKIGKFLKLPGAKLSKLADDQRKEELKRNLGDPPNPLFKEVRELILQKCQHDKEQQVRAIFEKQPFGELERLVTEKLLDVVKRVARDELENETWLHSVTRLTGRSYEAMRVSILEFLETDVFNVSVENCESFLDPLIESWDIDLATFSMEIVLNRRLLPGRATRFEFVESEPAVYYYRELQNLRDPVHFRELTAQPTTKKALGQAQPEGSVAPMHKYLEADCIERQLQPNSRKKAMQQWAGNRGNRGKRQKAKS